jgi:transcriptional regulator with XRE-family HTH domain
MVRKEIEPGELGEWLGDKRTERGWTQRQLADKLGVTDITISYWENGHSYPQPANLQAIQSLLGEVPAFAKDAERSEEDSTTTPIGAWLRNTRLSKGLSQVELAERAGVSYITISYIETGRTRSPWLTTVQALERVLGETASKEIESTIEAEQEVAEGLGEFYGPFPVDAWEEHAGDVACVYVMYDGLQRPVRIGHTGDLRRRLKEYEDNYWWFRKPTATTFAYVLIDDEETRKQVEETMIKLVGSHAIFNKQHTI